MDSLKHFILPISGMNEGEHFYEFSIDQEFFEHFENTPLSNGNLKVNLLVDKRPSFISLSFDLNGTVKAECDRCTANIGLPIVNQYESVIKMRSENSVSNSEEDVIYLSPFAEEFSVASLIYEIICLSVPMIKTVDCDNMDPRPCNTAVLEVLNRPVSNEESEENNVFKEAFKDLNLE